MNRFLQILTLLAIGSLSLFAEDKQKPIKALLITGGCCHNYVFQSQALIAGVAKHAKGKWRARDLLLLRTAAGYMG